MLILSASCTRVYIFIYIYYYDKVQRRKMQTAGELIVHERKVNRFVSVSRRLTANSCRLLCDERNTDQITNECAHTMNNIRQTIH